MLLRHLHPFVADRRATARTTETLSHAATSQKKRAEQGGSYAWHMALDGRRCAWSLLVNSSRPIALLSDALLLAS